MTATMEPVCIWTIAGDATSWAEWAATRGAAPPSLLAERLLARHPAPPGAWALDLGCGVGRAFAPLARQGFRVLGVDVTATAVQANASAIPAQEGRIALVLALGLLFHLGSDELERGLRRIAQVLAPGGVALLHFLDRADWRQRLGAPIAAEQVPASAHTAMVTRFRSHDGIMTCLRRAGLNPVASEPIAEEEEAGPRREWLVTCGRAAG